MCEFCTKHGEGKKWYLQMKNYSDELLHADLAGKQKELAKTPARLPWVQKYFDKYVLSASSARTQSGLRPSMPPMGGKSKLTEPEIVANRQQVHFGQVLPLEDVEAVIDLVDSITRIPCGCRYEATGKADHRYCFGFGVDKYGLMGSYPDAASSLEVIDKDRAKKIFRDYDTEGLVHTIWTGLTPYVVGLCNCDRDCGPYRRYIYAGGPPAFFRAEYLCQVDFERCRGCKSCLSQCQFGAMSWSSALGKVFIDPLHCFGCGLCRAFCPNQAIETLPREKVAQAAGLWLKTRQDEFPPG